MTTTRTYSVRKSAGGLEVRWTGEQADLTGRHPFSTDERRRGDQVPLLRVLETNDYMQVM